MEADSAAQTSPSTSSGGETGGVAVDSEKEDRDSGPPWATLPSHIVSDIAFYLYPWERVRMAKTCWRWYEGVLRSPPLWRSTDIRVRGNWRDNFEIDYVRYLGRYLKRLALCGSVRCQRHTKKFQRTVTTIFAHLYRQGPVQLEELTVTEFHFQSYFRGTSGGFARAGVLRSLKRFLRQQKRLRFVNFSFNTMSGEEGISLLTTLQSSRASAAKLLHLNIEELFKYKEEIYESESFVDAILSFTNLKVLVINYSCLSNELISGLSDAVECIGELERLDIRCSRSDSCEHIIHPTSWQSFKYAFPSAKVQMRLHSWIKLNDLQRILVSEIPLTNLVILGHNDDNFQPDRTLRLVAKTYRAVLEKFVIDVNPSYRTYHQSLVTLFRDCTKLRSLELRGGVEWPTLREIFEHMDEAHFKRGVRPQLGFFRMIVVGQSPESYTEEALVFEEFRDRLRALDLDYDLVVEPHFYPLPQEYVNDQQFVFQVLPDEAIVIE